MEANDAAIYGIVSALVEIDIQNIIFLTFLIIGCILIFLCVCGGCIALKRFCLIQCCFAIFLTLGFIVFLVLGIILIVVTGAVRYYFNSLRKKLISFMISYVFLSANSIRLILFTSSNAFFSKNFTFHQ